ncbi:hypothetical protein Bca4012_066564 [Brassica carinata]
MSDKCGSCDCADKTQCVKKGTSYTFDIVETQESYKEAMFMDVGAEENGCQCNSRSFRRQVQLQLLRWQQLVVPRRRRAFGPSSDGVNRSGAFSMTRDENPFSHGQAVERGSRLGLRSRNRDNRVTVTLAPENMKKPKRPLIQGPRELNDVLLRNSYVGFAGAMGRGVERHDIWSWSFENAAKNN